MCVFLCVRVCIYVQLMPFPYDLVQSVYTTTYIPRHVHVCVCVQLVPFPFDLVQRELRRYPNAEFLWCQEEPMNMGGYTHICPRLETCMRNEDREVSCSHSLETCCMLLLYLCFRGHSSTLFSGPAARRYYIQG